MINALTAVLGVLVVGMFTGMFFGARAACIAMGAGVVVVVGVAIRNTPPKTRALLLGGAAAVLGVIAYFTIGREAERHYVDRSMADIENKVATDAVAQYEMAKRQGDPIQTCVQAGFVSAAWLQARNEPQYVAAKATEKADCARAGIPRP